MLNVVLSPTILLTNYRSVFYPVSIHVGSYSRRRRAAGLFYSDYPQWVCRLALSEGDFGCNACCRPHGCLNEVGYAPSRECHESRWALNGWDFISSRRLCVRVGPQLLRSIPQQYPSCCLPDFVASIRTIFILNTRNQLFSMLWGTFSILLVEFVMEQHVE